MQFLVDYYLLTPLVIFVLPIDCVDETCYGRNPHRRLKRHLHIHVLRAHFSAGYSANSRTLYSAPEYLHNRHA